ncbi:MAG TPA: protein-export chaperone SecB [Patescibacteria group bacterium]|nr:protein-export chaperone SecB [Patescibacteria group bacterium]
MTDTAPVANGAADQQQMAQIAIQKIYVKDASFEAPNAPMIFQDSGQPNIQLNLNQKVQTIGDNVYEVVLTVTLTCKISDKTAYLAEVQQAGIFSLIGFDQATLHGMLGTFAPNTLFPYARQAISALVLDGGFPPFVLQPVNFDQIYADTMRRRAQEQPSDATA